MIYMYIYHFYCMLNNCHIGQFYHLLFLTLAYSFSTIFAIILHTWCWNCYIWHNFVHSAHIKIFPGFSWTVTTHILFLAFTSRLQPWTQTGGGQHVVFIYSEHVFELRITKPWMRGWRKLWNFHPQRCSKRKRTPLSNMLQTRLALGVIRWLLQHSSNPRYFVVLQRESHP